MIVACLAYDPGGVHADQERRGQRPNLLFVFADQMRGSAMGFLGEEPVVTPNLDRLATEAIVFTEAASNYPVCSPYRAMLMTGQYPHRNGVISNCLSRTAPYGVELKTEAHVIVDVTPARADPSELRWDLSADSAGLRVHCKSSP
ncbi:MAG TPA: sulfatase-like hydrolase/transferase [Thermoguttaceae bacterium]|nr:sulfatase-like hydrolase/transferase [Thermoguttaceae bacterium]